MTQEKGKGMTGYGGIVGFMSNGSGDDARSLIRYTRGAKLLVITVSFMQIYTRLPVKVKVFTVPVKGCTVMVNHP